MACKVGDRLRLERQGVTINKGDIVTLKTDLEATWGPEVWEAIRSDGYIVMLGSVNDPTWWTNLGPAESLPTMRSVAQSSQVKSSSPVSTPVNDSTCKTCGNTRYSSVEIAAGIKCWLCGS